MTMSQDTTMLYSWHHISLVYITILIFFCPCHPASRHSGPHPLLLASETDPQYTQQKEEEELVACLLCPVDWHGYLLAMKEEDKDKGEANDDGNDKSNDEDKEVEEEKMGWKEEEEDEEK